MATIVVNGRITPAGKLEVDLPDGLPSGEVRVILELPQESDAAWTDEEIREMLKPSPKSGAEIAAMLDEMEPGYQHIEDSAAWVEEQRRKRSEEHRW